MHCSITVNICETEFEKRDQKSQEDEAIIRLSSKNKILIVSTITITPTSFYSATDFSTKIKIKISCQKQHYKVPQILSLRLIISECHILLASVIRFDAFGLSSLIVRQLHHLPKIYE